jgi:hypothetical protein
VWVGRSGGWSPLLRAVVHLRAVVACVIGVPPSMDRSLRGGAGGVIWRPQGQVGADLGSTPKLLRQQQQKGAEGASRAAAGAPLHVSGG